MPVTNSVSSRYNLMCERLGQHPLYDAIHSKDNLRIFMEHHVYAVWDFMSLIKSLQVHLAPTRLPWVPPKNPRHAGFINQLVLEEESDRTLADSTGSTHTSHFENYLRAMVETGADIHTVSRFVDMANGKGIETALRISGIPTPARRFMAFTFNIIDRNQPHLLAAVLAYGRETLVPRLFRSLREGLQISRSGAPGLYSYLERHVQLDEQEHGPLAALMVWELCTSTRQRNEATEVAERALEARLDFWNGIYAALPAH